MPERWEQIAELADGTLTRQEVADKLGITLGSLYNHTGRAIASGRDVRFAPRPYRGTRAKWRDIVEFCKNGDKTRAETAAHFGMGDEALRKLVYHLPRRHQIAVTFADIKPQPVPRFRAELRRGDARAGGGIAQLVNSLPDEIGEWLAAQVPEDGTFADVIRGIVTDQYFDEQDDLQARAIMREAAA